MVDGSGGLLANWREMLELRRNFLAEANCRFLPAVPNAIDAGTPPSRAG